MVWLRSARAEGGHHTIPHELLHHTTANQDRTNDLLEMRVENVQQGSRIVRQTLGQSREPADVSEKDGRRAHDGGSKSLSGWHFGDALDVPLPEQHQASQVVGLHRRLFRALQLNQRVPRSGGIALAIKFAADPAIPDSCEALLSRPPF